MVAKNSAKRYRGILWGLLLAAAFCALALSGAAWTAASADDTDKTQVEIGQSMKNAVYRMWTVWYEPNDPESDHGLANYVSVRNECVEDISDLSDKGFSFAFNRGDYPLILRLDETDTLNYPVFLNATQEVGGVQVPLFNLGTTEEPVYEITYADNVYSSLTLGERHALTSTVTLTLNDKFTDNGNQFVTFTREWYVVTAQNEARRNPRASGNIPDSWLYGTERVVYDDLWYRPLYGDEAVYVFHNKTNNTDTEIGVLFNEGRDTDLVLGFYETESGAIDTDRPLTDVRSLNDCLRRLPEGEYTFTVRTMQAQSTLRGASTPWYDDESPLDNYGTVYIANEQEIKSFTVKLNALTVTVTDPITGAEETVWADGVTFSLVSNAVVYNGEQNNLPAVTITANGNLLQEGVDYELFSDSKDAGAANLTVRGIGSYGGEITLFSAYEILKASNIWDTVPSVVYWAYGSYDKTVNLIHAVPRYLEEAHDLWYRVSTDPEGNDFLVGLGRFYTEDGVVTSDTVANILSGLPVGTYYLSAQVDGTANYERLAPAAIPFRVFRATNTWDISPGIASWTVGKYNAETNAAIASPHFGTAVLTVTDSRGKVLYDSAQGINKLASAKTGTYTLTAYVAGTDDYSELASQPYYFRVLKKSGMPWWGILLIVIGVLLVVAAVLFILWKKGVFRILTDKITLAIRARATVDATIAAVRANKKSEEAKLTVAKAEREDRAAARREAAKAERNLPVEEKAKAMEEKAKQAELRAEKSRARAEAYRAKVERMLEQARPSAEAAATQNGSDEQNKDDQTE